VPATSNDSQTTPTISTSLPDDTATLKQMVEHLLSDVQDKDREILQLKFQLETLRRRIFGRRSEKVDPNQLALFEDLSRQLEAAEAQQPETEDDETPPRKPKRKGNGHGRRPLPPDLPRDRIVHELSEEERTCPCCSQPMEPIGEEITEKLDYVPASFVVREHVRPKYACKACAEGVLTAALPPQPIAKGIAGAGLLAQVLTSKYCDHLPLHRQRGIFRRHRVELSDSTLCDWVRDMADLLSPIVVAMKAQVLQSHVVNTDDTPVLVQNRLGKASGRGYLWVYIGDGKQAVFDFTDNRSRAGPVSFFGNYSGYVQADAYSGYQELFQKTGRQDDPRCVEVGCWAHARRKFYDARLDDRRRCTEMLGLIRRLYDVERRAKEEIADRAAHAIASESAAAFPNQPDRSRGAVESSTRTRNDEIAADAKIRLKLRGERSVPVLAEIRERLEAWSIELLPKNPVAQAVGYALGRWTALTRYVEDGRLSIDNNVSERTLRMAAVGRKNWMFFGSEAGGHRAAVIYSLTASCKLCGIDPFAYLRDAITQTCNPTFKDFADLTPLAWQANQQTLPPN